MPALRVLRAWLVGACMHDSGGWCLHARHMHARRELHAALATDVHCMLERLCACKARQTPGTCSGHGPSRNLYCKHLHIALSSAASAQLPQAPCSPRVIRAVRSLLGRPRLEQVPVSAAAAYNLAGSSTTLAAAQAWVGEAVLGVRRARGPLHSKCSQQQQAGAASSDGQQPTAGPQQLARA